MKRVRVLQGEPHKQTKTGDLGTVTGKTDIAFGVPTSIVRIDRTQRHAYIPDTLLEVLGG